MNDTCTSHRAFHSRFNSAGAWRCSPPRAGGVLLEVHGILHPLPHVQQPRRARRRPAPPCGPRSSCPTPTPPPAAPSVGARGPPPAHRRKRARAPSRRLNLQRQVHDGLLDRGNARTRVWGFNARRCSDLRSRARSATLQHERELVVRVVLHKPGEVKYSPSKGEILRLAQVQPVHLLQHGPRGAFTPAYSGSYPVLVVLEPGVSAVRDDVLLRPGGRRGRIGRAGARRDLRSARVSAAAESVVAARDPSRLAPPVADVVPALVQSVAVLRNVGVAPAVGRGGGRGVRGGGGGSRARADGDVSLLHRPPPAGSRRAGGTGPAPEAHARVVVVLVHVEVEVQVVLRRGRAERGRTPSAERGARSRRRGARARGGVAFRSRRRGASRVGSRGGRVSARGDRRGGRAGRSGDAHRSTDGSDATCWVTGRRRGSVETRVPSKWSNGYAGLPRKSRFFTFWRDFLARSFQSSLSENMSTKTARGDTRDEEPRQSAFARSSSSRDAREQASEAAWSVDIARATMSVAAAAKMALAFAELTGGVKFDGKKHHAEMSRFSVKKTHGGGGGGSGSARSGEGASGSGRTGGRDGGNAGGSGRKNRRTSRPASASARGASRRRRTPTTTPSRCSAREARLA